MKEAAKPSGSRFSRELSAPRWWLCRLGELEAGGDAVGALAGGIELADGVGGAVTSEDPLALGVADLPGVLAVAGVGCGRASVAAGGSLGSSGSEGGHDGDEKGRVLHVEGCC